MTTLTPARTSQTDRTWMVPGALIAGIGGALLLAACNALVNFTPGWIEADSTAELVTVAGDHPLLCEVIVIIGVLSAILLIPGIWAVAARLAPRAPRLAAVGGWLMASGYVCAFILHTDTVTSLLVAGSDLDPAAYGEAIDGQLLLSQTAIYALFGLGTLLGGVVLAIAMLRQRGHVPAWAGWLLLASEPVRVAGLLLGIPLGPPIASLLIVGAFAAVLLGQRQSGLPAGGGDLIADAVQDR